MLANGFGSRPGGYLIFFVEKCWLATEYCINFVVVFNKQDNITYI